MSDGKHKVATR